VLQLIVSFYGDSFLNVDQAFGVGTMWKWAVLLMFQRNVLPPSSVLLTSALTEAVCFSEMLVTLTTSTQCHTQKQDQQ
jgi:hypothetical protein